MNRFISFLACLAMGSSAVLAQGVSVAGVRGPEMPPQTRPELHAGINAAEWQRAGATIMPQVNVAGLQAEDAARRGQKGVPLRVGIDRAVGVRIDPGIAAGWQQDADGITAWRWIVVDPGARAIRLSFSNISLGDGDTLIVTDALGLVTHEFADTNAGQLAWTPALAGEAAWIELRTAKPPKAGTALAVLEGVSHIYDPSFGPWPADETVPLDTCNVSVACRSVDNVARDSVGRMLFSSGGGQFVCTGAALNDVDPTTFRLWFLTANHCLSTQAEVSSLTVYWFYQPALCGGAIPSLFSRPRNIGGTLLATNPGTDFTFIELAGQPPSGLGFAGWTTNPVAGTVRGIHHPGGGAKEYSEGAIQGGLNCSGFSAIRYYYGVWTDGTTEGGSSGSPLFNPNWQIVGQLFGTCCPSSHGNGCENSNCSNRSQWRWVYGRFDVTFLQVAGFLSASDGVWVDVAYSGPEDGSQNRPFNTLAEGIAAAPCNGRVILVGPRTALQTGVFSRPSNCAVNIVSFGGNVTIGQ